MARAIVLAPDSKVRIRSWTPPGHIRVPWYLRGKAGIIERKLGEFHNPEQRAFGLPADKLALFRVRFLMTELWGSDYGCPGDTLDADIYSHWITPIDSGKALNNRTTES